MKSVTNQILNIEENLFTKVYGEINPRNYTQRSSMIFRADKSSFWDTIFSLKIYPSLKYYDEKSPMDNVEDLIIIIERYLNVVTVKDNSNW